MAGLLDMFGPLLGIPASTAADPNSEFTPEMQRYIAGQRLQGIGAGLMKAGGASRIPVGLLDAVGGAMDQGNQYADQGMGLLGQASRQQLYRQQAAKAKAEADAQARSDREFGLLPEGQNSPAMPQPSQPQPIRAPAPLTSNQYSEAFNAAGAKYGIDPKILDQIAKVESNYNPNARNPGSTASGMMQMTDAAWKDVQGDPTKRFDPAANIDGGARYLAMQRDRFGGDINKAVMAYNQGGGAINSGRPEALAAGQQYAQRVLGQPTATDASPSPQQPPQQGYTAAERQYLAQPGTPQQRAERMWNIQQARQRDAQQNRVKTPEQVQQEMQIRAAGVAPDRTMIQVPDPKSPTGFSYVPRASITPGTPAMGPNGTAMEFTDDGKVKSIAMGPGVGKGGINAGGMTQTNQTDINKQLMDATATRMQLTDIASKFKPEYQQFLPRAGMEWAALKDRFGTLAPADRTKLADFTQYRASAAQNFTGILKNLSGQAVTPGEAKRAEAWIPNAGTGMFDGDSPTELSSKLDRFTDFTNKAVARLHYAAKNGLSVDKVPLEDMPKVMNERGIAIKSQLIQSRPGLSDEQADTMTRDLLAREFGLAGR